MEDQVSEILENILGLLALEGSFEVTEKEDEIRVSIETQDSGRLIGYRGETLDALQLLVNQILSKKSEQFKRVIIDVGGWRKGKEEDLERRAMGWAQEVIESGELIELEPMPSWQRRIVHMAVSGVKGVESESVGEGSERHLVIKPAAAEDKPKKEKSEKSEKKEKIVKKDKQAKTSKKDLIAEPKVEESEEQTS